MLLGIQRHFAVLGEVPVGEQVQFALKQGLVVRRQLSSFGGQLPAQQLVSGLLVQGQLVLRALGVDGRHHGAVAQVAEQHEPVGLVPSQHLGGVQPGVMHEAGHMHKGLTVFLVRRRVHDDAGAGVLRFDAQVAAKAGICRGNAHAGWVQTVLRRDVLKPGFKALLALRIGPAHTLRGLQGY